MSTCRASEHMRLWTHLLGQSAVVLGYWGCCRRSVCMAHNQGSAATLVKEKQQAEEASTADAPASKQQQLVGYSSSMSPRYR